MKWKHIPGTKKIYSASIDGQIRSNTCKRGDGRRVKGKILKPWLNNSGYLMVSLRIDGETIRKTVHSLIAKTFLGKRPKGYDIDHIDGNKTNNSLENLEYITRNENLKRYYKTNGKNRLPSKKVLEERDKRAKYFKEKYSKPINQYSIDGTLIHQYDSIREAEISLRGKPTSLLKRVANKNLTAYGYKWKFAK